MTESIQHRFFFSHPPQTVWEYLTNAELMELWLMKSNFQPTVGHEFQFRTNPKADFNFDGIFYCKVLEVVPFQKLSYTWKCGPGDGTFNIDSVVNWTLEQKNNGTELLLEHNDFAIMNNLMLFNSMQEGWLKNIHKIAQRINERYGTANA
ncbi:MAG: SRPBCC family protein [Mucilaginibacter sp.]